MIASLESHMDVHTAKLSPTIEGSPLTSITLGGIQSDNTPSDPNLTFTSALSAFTPPKHPHHLSPRAYDFSLAALQQHIQLKPPYTTDSKTIRALYSLLASFTPEQQHAFLVFTTGLQSLPINGLAALQPSLNIVRVDHRQPHTILPSAMTCTRTLKLPDYGDDAVLCQRVLQAISETGEAFLLS